MPTVIIDSRDRPSGASLDNFRIEFDRPITNVRKCTLAFAAIDNPGGAAYWYMRIPELSSAHDHAHGVNSYSDSGSFVIPVTSATLSTNYFSQHGDWEAFIDFGEPRTIHGLTIRLTVRGGGPAGIANDWYAILRLD